MAPGRLLKERRAETLVAVAIPMAPGRLHKERRAETLVAVAQGHELRSRDAFAEVEAHLDGHRLAVLLGHLVVVAHVWHSLLHGGVVHEAADFVVASGLPVRV